MNNIPKGEKKHIVFVGRRNVGKSSLVNAILNQDLCITSEIPGTTTDPIKKTIELLPYGPVILIDTAGIDDSGELGDKRKSKTIKALSSADFAIVVLDGCCTLTSEEKKLFQYLHRISLPYLIAVNKIEFGVNPDLLIEIKALKSIHFEISCSENVGIDFLKAKLTRLLPQNSSDPIIGDLVGPGDVVVLVVPIDLSAPKGRLILPQVQTLRECLDINTIVIVAKDTELRSVLTKLKNPPKLVVTDSQVIMKVIAEIPESIALTTFSILMARHKGDLSIFVNGLKRIEELKDDDKVLIAEACTHHTMDDDIGRVKIPKWLRDHTKKNLKIDIKSGGDFPENLSEYKLIIHCGGCMLTRAAMHSRIRQAKIMEVPIVNYGMLISYMHGAMPRVLVPFDEASYQWSRTIRAV